MRILIRVLLAALLALVVLAAVLVFRTLTFSPPTAHQADVALAQAPAIDIDAAARHLSEAIQIKTVSASEGGADDHTEWLRLRDWAERTYPATHAALTREFVAGYTPIYTWAGSDPSLPPIVLMAHQDVVPVAGESEKDWKHPPFAGVIADGAIWGRGSIDDKGSMVALFESVEALLGAGFKPTRTVMIVNGHDEEAAQSGSQTVAALMQQRGVKAEFVLDEGLITVANFPLLKGPAALIGVAEKGYGNLKVIAHAAGGHSSMPPDRTAVTALSDAVLRIRDNGHPMQIAGAAALMMDAVSPHVSFVTKMAIANQWLFKSLLISEFAKTPAGAAMLHTTTAPTMLSGSPKANVLADTAEAVINYRFLPGDAPEDALARARHAIGDASDVSVDWLDSEAKPASPVSSTQTESWAILAALASEGGAIPVAPSLVLAATDSYHLNAVAADTYRYQPLILALDETAMIHGVNEHMTLENYQRMISFYARLIATAAAR